MSDLKFTCTGCRNGCVITVCYNEEGYPDVKGNGCNARRIDMQMTK